MEVIIHYAVMMYITVEALVNLGLYIRADPLQYKIESAIAVLIIHALLFTACSVIYTAFNDCEPTYTADSPHAQRAVQSPC